MILSAEKILLKHYKDNLHLCVRNVKEKEYIKNKYVHSYQTQLCGCHISENMDIDKNIVSDVLLLHDIGRFYEHCHFPNFKHAEFGYKILMQENISDARILLPIRYHETENWLNALSADCVYTSLSQETQKQIKLLCQILIESDVIANMLILTKEKQHNNDDVLSLSVPILENLFSGKLADNADIYTEADAIVYILCGLKLIHLAESKKYIIKYKIINHLINRLFSFALVTNDVHMKTTVCRIRDYIHTTYDF